MNIPKYIKSFNRINVDRDEDLKKRLIEVFQNGGIPIDEYIKSRVSDAKPSIMYIANKERIKPLVKDIKDIKKQIQQGDYVQGYWLYCGEGYYVRCIEKNYEFAKYAKYDTEEMKIVDDWNDKGMNNA